MINKDTLLKGLQYCRSSCAPDDCEYCPFGYDCGDSIMPESWNSLPPSLLDAIEKYLKGEPELLTAEEVKELDAGESIWLEWIGIDRIDGEPFHYLDHGVITPEYEIHFDGTYTSQSSFSLKWEKDFKERCWSAEPSKELMEATPWE